MSRIDEIFAVLDCRGQGMYGGEQVRQLDHGLQCAALAEHAGAPAPLIAAALLHDIGHLIEVAADATAASGLDDRHELRGREWLARWFGEAITEPVRLHVNAKRYLTAIEPGYLAILSPASIRSLTLQGGPFSPALARGFISLPYAAEAVQLRRWDDSAKVRGQATPTLEHFRPYMRACLSDQ